LLLQVRSRDQICLPPGRQNDTGIEYPGRVLRNGSVRECRDGAIRDGPVTPKRGECRTHELEAFQGAAGDDTMVRSVGPSISAPREYALDVDRGAPVLGCRDEEGRVPDLRAELG